MRQDGQFPQLPHGELPAPRGAPAAGSTDGGVEELFMNGGLLLELELEWDDEDDEPISPARPNNPLRPDAGVDDSGSCLSMASLATSFKSMPAIFASSARDWHFTSLTAAAVIKSNKDNFQPMMSETDRRLTPGSGLEFSYIPRKMMRGEGVMTMEKLFVRVTR